VDTSRHWPLRGTAAVVGVLLLSSCVATTTVTAVWRDEAYSGRPHKALVLLATGGPLLIRVFEDAFVQQLQARGINAVAGYTLLPVDRQLSKDEIDAAVKKIDADALFITRLVNRQSYNVYYPGSVYVSHSSPPVRGWGGFYAGGYNSYYVTPGYTAQQEILHVETQLYDVHSERLIWSVMTETYTGKAVESEVNDFLKVIMKSLTKNGLIGRS
jgi:hypothetical protein